MSGHLVVDAKGRANEATDPEDRPGAARDAWAALAGRVS